MGGGTGEGVPRGGSKMVRVTGKMGGCLGETEALGGSRTETRVPVKGIPGKIGRPGVTEALEDSRTETRVPVKDILKKIALLDGT